MTKTPHLTSRCRRPPVRLTGANRNDSQEAPALVDAILPLQGAPGGRGGGRTVCSRIVPTTRRRFGVGCGSGTDNAKRQQLTASSKRRKTSLSHSSSMQRAADETSEDEEQERIASGHARDADSEDVVDRVDARLRHRA